MKPKHFDKNNPEDILILNKHLLKYMDGVNVTLLLTEIIVLVSTFVLSIFILEGFYPYEMHVNIQNITKEMYIHCLYWNRLFDWIILGIYFLLYKKVSFKHRKILLLSAIIILISSISFGNWNVNYFGFFFITPIIIASPFSKKTNKIIFSICFILNCLYTILQEMIRHDRYNYLLGLVTITVLIAFYFISLRLHKTMYDALIEIKQYTNISKELYKEVSLDYLTKAFSVSSLHKDLNEDNKFKSMAFLDIDDFKNINDKNSHDTGDNILKLLVSNIKSSNERIYRYGGDEFVILSELSAIELAKKIEVVKTEFSNTAEKLYSVKATISVGVINIVVKERLFEYLKQCDKLMYISKYSGKNKVTVEEA